MAKWLLVLAIFLSVTSFAKDRGIADNLADPHLQRDYLQADAYTRAIVEEHERLFPGALKARQPNYTDLGRLGRIQKALFDYLQKVDGYARDMKERGPLIDLQVKVVKEQIVEDLSVDLNVWQRFKNQLFQTPRWEQDFFQMLTQSSPTLQNLAEREADKLANLVSLPFPDRSKIEGQTIMYTMVAALAERHDVTNVNEWQKVVGELSQADLDHLQDENTYLPLLAKVGNGLRSAAEWKTTMQSAYQRLREAMFVDHSIRLMAESYITLREVHPLVGILRGYVGQDCATYCSPGFVFTPYDRYFYVFDEKEFALGYVGISLVKIGGEKAIFLHTIQGEKLNGGHAQLVILGLKKVMSKFGANRVVLSSDEMIKHLVNYPAIRQTMLRAVSGQTQLKVEWLDRDYRRFITQFDSILEFDNPDYNQVGREPAGDPSIVSVKTTKTPFNLEKLPDTSCDQNMKPQT